jgi:ribosome maturation factor RimP
VEYFLNGTLLTEIRKLAEEASANVGCYLYDLEFVGAGGNRALRVYIEKDSATASASHEASDDSMTEISADDADGDEMVISGGTGASIEDCSKVSRFMSEKLEAMEDQIPGGAYELEVSTPGLERVLKEPWHFEKAIGKKISVKSFQPLSQFNETVPELGLAKQVQGQLVSFDANGVRVVFESAPRKDGAEAPVVFVPFDSVTKAHVVFEFVDPSVKKTAAKKGHGPKKKSAVKTLE